MEPLASQATIIPPANLNARVVVPFLNAESLSEESEASPRKSRANLAD